MEIVNLIQKVIIAELEYAQVLIIILTLIHYVLNIKMDVLQQERDVLQQKEHVHLMMEMLQHV